MTIVRQIPGEFLRHGRMRQDHRSARILEQHRNAVRWIPWIKRHIGSSGFCLRSGQAECQLRFFWNDLPSWPLPPGCAEKPEDPMCRLIQGIHRTAFDAARGFWRSGGPDAFFRGEETPPWDLADGLSWMPRKRAILSMPSFLHAARSILRTWPTFSSHRVQRSAQRRANYARELAEPSALHQRAFNVTSADLATLQASPGFDAAVWELWPYLTIGAECPRCG